MKIYIPLFSTLLLVGCSGRPSEDAAAIIAELENYLHVEGIQQLNSQLGTYAYKDRRFSYNREYDYFIEYPKDYIPLQSMRNWMLIMSPDSTIYIRTYVMPDNPDKEIGYYRSWGNEKGEFEKSYIYNGCIHAGKLGKGKYSVRLYMKDGERKELQKYIDAFPYTDLEVSIKRAADSVRVLRECTEKARAYYIQNSVNTECRIRHWPFVACYEAEPTRAFVDSMEMIYHPYKQLLVNEKELRATYGDSDIKLEFARDTCWLHTYDRYEDYMEHDANNIDIQNFVAHYHYVRLRKMVDKYYNYLFERLKENAESRASVDVERYKALPQRHKLWEKLHEEEIDWYYWSWEILFKKMEQQMQLYYDQTLYYTYFGNR